MKPNTLRCTVFSCLATMTFLATQVDPACAQSPIKLQNWSGTIDLSMDNPVLYEMSGTASHLGQFTAEGEVVFVPVDSSGARLGDGIVVFRAGNGDLLVGKALWEIESADDNKSPGSIHFSWRDSVEFSDGRIAYSTGRFASQRPPGLIIRVIFIFGIPIFY